MSFRSDNKEKGVCLRLEGAVRGKRGREERSERKGKKERERERERERDREEKNERGREVRWR